MTLVRCQVKRGAGTRCGGLLLHRSDAIGRLRWHCPKCKRRKAGICQDCPCPVAGAVGKAERCAPCEVLHRRKRALTYRHRNLEVVQARQRAHDARRRREKRGGRPPMSSREQGLLGGAARAQALTPERRSEIARQAVETRWAKWRREHAPHHPLAEAS